MPKRGENIYKRKDGRWEGRYIRGRSPSGGAVYGYVYACSYRECRVKRQKQLEALGDAPEQAASLTLAQAAGRFLADREKQLKESTRARYAYLLRHYILPGLGESPVGQLTANGISDFLGGLQRGGLSGKSARDVGVLLKSVLKYSVRRLECSCPGLEAELPVYRRKQVSVFSADEVQRLARWVLSAPDGTGVAVLLALNTGLRLGELCALQFGDIDLKSGVVRVSKTVQRIPGEGGTRLAVQPPKSDSSRRAVPLPGDMAALLNRLPRSDSAQRYFLTGTDTPMEPRTMQYRYRALLKAAGITINVYAWQNKLTIGVGGNGAEDFAKDNALTCYPTENYTFTVNKSEYYDYTVTATYWQKKLSGIWGTVRLTVRDNGDGTYTIVRMPEIIERYELANVDVTITITKTAKAVDPDAVAAYEYVQLDGKTVVLVTVTGRPGSGKVFTYDGNAMFKANNYGWDLYSWLLILDKGEALDVDALKADVISKLALDDGTATTISQVYDVNKSGRMDINDAQLVYDIYNGTYFDFTKVSMEKFLLADVNCDKMVNSADAVVIVGQFR